MNLITRTTYTNFCNGNTAEKPAPHSAARKIVTRMDNQQRFLQIANDVYGETVDMTYLTPDGALHIQQMAEKTTDAIKKGAETIFNATFADPQVPCFTIVDILHKEKEGYVINRIYNGCGRTKLYPGLAYDKWLLEHCGVPVAKVVIVSSRTDKEGTIQTNTKDVSIDIQEDYIRVPANIEKMVNER